MLLLRIGNAVIHSVRNPSAVQLCGGIHAYSEDCFAAIPRRHFWDPETLKRGPYDHAFINALRDEANARMAALRQQGVEVS